MSEAFEQGLEELVPRYEHEPRRWDEVLKRASASRSRRRRGLVLALAAGLTAVALAAGGAFHREFVDFFSAEPHPSRSGSTSRRWAPASTWSWGLATRRTRRVKS